MTRAAATTLLPEIDRACREVRVLLRGATASGALGAAGGRLRDLEQQAVATLRTLPARDPAARPLASGLAELDEVRHELRDRLLGKRVRRLEQAEEALARLRGILSSAELVERVCHEVVDRCGFRRAMLSRVEGSVWLPWKAHFDSDSESERELAQWMADARIPFSEMTVEMEVIDTSRAALVLDAPATGRFHRLVPGSRTVSYVVAPIMPGGGVVGLLHADHWPDERAVDGLDRDVLWAFASGFEQIYERAVLGERLRDQRARVREKLRAAEAMMDAVCDSEIELARRFEQGTASVAALPAPSERALDEALTPREREVLALMVRGLSNARIAERLVLTEGTVKSHVKHILRKVGAMNRSEAISRYLGLVNGDG
jgi:LuxR family transcriptional regulator, regulator of acetate metabolism